MVKEEIVREVLQKALLSPYELVQQAALEMTLTLSADVGFCAAVEESGLVSALVPYLSVSDGSVQLSTLLILVHFTAVSKKNRITVCIPSSGKPPPPPQ